MKELRQKTYNLLRKSEKYFKTDMVYLARGSFWLSTGQVVASISAFLLAVAFANFLPKETYGTYKYILAVAGVLMIFTLTGMGSAVIQSIAKGINVNIFQAIKAKLGWGSLSSIISFGAALYYYLHSNTTLSFSFLIIALFLPLMEAFGLYEPILQGKKDFRTSTTYFIVGQCGSVFFSILVLILTKNIILLVLSYFLSWTLFRYLFFKRTVGCVAIEPKNCVDVVPYGKHLSFMGILNTLATYADQILLFHFVGATETAVYAIALAIPEQTKGLFKNISVLAYPKFSEKTISEIKGTIYSKVFKFGSIILVGTFVYIFLAPFIYKLLFPQYLDSVLYSQIFALSMISILATIPIAVLQSQKRTRDLYMYSTITPIIQLILFFVLIPFYGLMGAVVSRVISRFFNLSFSFILFIRARD